MKETFNIKNELIKNKDENYRKFSSSLLPKINNILGVRLPILRKLAKEIYKTDYKNFLKTKSEYMEETMLKGMIIGLISKNNKENIFYYMKNFIPLIDNWSICDSFCCSLSFDKSQKQKLWDFIINYFDSDSQYSKRFALVMMLNHFVDEEYIFKIFDKLNNFKSDKYYAQMACAWLISICYIKFKKETKVFLNSSQLDKFTYNKSIQKIIESNRICVEEKNELKKLKK